MRSTAACLRPRRALLATLLSASAAFFAAPAAHAGADPFIGEVMLFGGNWCPVDYLPADGRQLPINQYQALYTLIGVTYGGDGVSSFMLPDLRGRTPIAQGQGPGLSNLPIGNRGGAEQTTLQINQLPQHTHSVTATTAPATHTTPGGGRVPAQALNAGVYAAAGGPIVDMGSTGPTGQGAPVATRSPYLVMNWCIAVNGNYPPRP